MGKIKKSFGSLKAVSVKKAMANSVPVGMVFDTVKDAGAPDNQPCSEVGEVDSCTGYDNDYISSCHGFSDGACDFEITPGADSGFGDPI